MAVFDAVVLAGGSARRLGGVAKPQLVINGVSLLDRVVSAVADAARVIVVGPQQPVQQPVCHPVTWVREDPPGAGPVAALAAALPQTGEPVVVVLAADLPWIAPAIPKLLDSLVLVRADDNSPSKTVISDQDKENPGVAMLADRNGRANFLAAAWQREALAAALGRVADPNGAAVKTLLAGLEPVLVTDTDGWAADCDTWDDVRAAREHAGEPSER